MSTHSIESRKRWDLRFVGLAQYISTWSYDPSTKCGAVIVDPKRRIVSTGFNGFPRSMPDHTALYEDRDEKYPRIVHADMNALLFAKADLDGFTIYTWPFLPCARCFVHLAQAGITRYVAPPPVEARHIERWGPEIQKSKQYASEMGLTIVEIEVARKVTPAPNATYVDTGFDCASCHGPLVCHRDFGAPRWCPDKACVQYLYEQHGEERQS